MERERSLKWLFIKYLVSWLLGSLILAFLGFILMSLAMQAGYIYPANYGDIEYEREKDNLKNTEEIRMEDIPPLMDYALFTEDGTWKEGTIPEKDAEKAWEVSHRGYSGISRIFYRKVEREGEVLVLRYSIKAQFADPKLRKYLPAAEEIIYGCVILEILAFLMYMAVRFGRMLERKMNGIQSAIEKIEQENLEFQVQNCGVREIDRVGAALDHMKEALKKSLVSQWHMEKARQEKISALAHDLKTPITIVRGYNELLLESTLKEEDLACVEAIEVSIRQMQGYVEQLLDMTRGKQPAEFVKNIVCADAFLEDIHKKSQGLAAEKQAVLIWQAAEIRREIQADEQRLERALLNIIANAAEYAGQGGTICLGASAPEGGLEIIVEDSGPGFTGEALKKGKEEFYTGSSARSGGVHSGLGLCIADRIIEEHGGRLELGNSEVFGGGCVRVWLPW